MNDKQLELWTVYQNTSDYPGQYVARKFLNDQPTAEMFVSARMLPGMRKHRGIEQRQLQPGRLRRLTAVADVADQIGDQLGLRFVALGSVGGDFAEHIGGEPEKTNINHPQPISSGLTGPLPTALPSA
jgi:hypothetical protein